MAIKLRCVECYKKLQVDDGFAGSVCRCPYCAATMPVPWPRRLGGGGFGPTLPGGRPETPGAIAGSQAEAQQQYIPLARPVRMQGIAALVLLGLAVVMAAGVGIVLMTYMQDSGRKKNAEQEKPLGGRPAVQPERGRPASRKTGKPAPTGPSIGDVQITPPVVYCIGSASAGAVDSAMAKTLQSIKTLGANGKFNVVLCFPDSYEAMSADLAAGGEPGVEKARQFADKAVGCSIMFLGRAVADVAARQPAPKTIAIFVSDALPDEDADRVVAAADAAGAKVVTVLLTSDESTIEKMQQLWEKLKIKGDLIVEKWTGF